MEAVINTGGGGAGIIVQAAPSAVVSLRGPTIDMRGTANIGISFAPARAQQSGSGNLTVSGNGAGLCAIHALG